MLKEKRQGYGLEMKIFTGKDGKSYLVFRTQDGAYHTFVEVESKQVARECGSTLDANTRQKWDKLWEQL